MREKKIPALFVSKPENIVYLSGFHSSNCQLILAGEQNILFTDFRYIEAAESLSEIYQLVLTDREHTVPDYLKTFDIADIAIEEETVNVSVYKQLQKSVSGSILRGDGLIEDIRSIKDEKELSAIMKAEALGDHCFSHMLNFIRQGMTELEVSREIGLFFLKNGAERLSFDTICVSGERTSLPHGEPTGKRIEKGDFITLDFGCVVDGYCSDMTRTLVLGKASTEQKELYQIVLSAQLAACGAVRAGITGAAADRAARDVIAEAGYGEMFGHGTGHGVGLEIHEAPTLNPGSGEILQEGMTVTIEPGIYLPKKFGVRIEDLSIVTVSGIINTTKSNKELIEL